MKTKLLKIAVGLMIIGFSTSASASMFQSVDKKDAVLVQKGAEKQYCARCGMNLVMFYKTSHAAKHGDKEYQYCSIHCLAEHMSQEELSDVKVVDVTSLKLIDATKAYYVVGSKVHGTMSRISKYAFLNESDAKDFQAKNGGEIMGFKGALEKAKEDFQ